MNGRHFRKGATRYVIRVWRFAVKVPRTHGWRTFLNGLLGNMQEREFARFLDGYVAPVVFSLPGGFCNVMPWVEDIGRGHADQFFAWMDSAAKGDDEDAKKARCLLNIVERKADSVGMLNGRLLAIDYGS